ncbi:MAG: alpha/beta hydrolase, partial [Acidimicrobiales bacterium]
MGELDPRQECALLAVPLDYDDPDGPTIDVAVSRIATADAALREGVILFNPGGPGGEGLNLPTLVAQLLEPEVLARFDLVGFDPRFIGRSTPVTCGLPVDEHLILKFIPWLRPGGVAENFAVAEELSAACAANGGEILVHGTTANTARDMDRIREALGEEKISYVGYSYGSYLGAVYASLFPDRTDRFVLDSVVNPFGIWRNVFRSWGPAVEIRFPDLTGWVADHNDIYGLGATSSEVRAKYFELAARLDVDPIQLPGVLLTGNQFREATRGSLYDDRSFPFLAELWQFVDQSSGPAGGAPAPLDAGALALFPEVPADNPVAAALTVLCDDAEWPRDLGHYERAVRIDGRLFPVAGAMAANAWTCAAWHFDPVDPLVGIHDDGPANVLLVQNTRDPATPYWGAIAMRVALGGRSRLVTVNEGGHGVFA